MVALTGEVVEISIDFGKELNFHETVDLDYVYRRCKESGIVLHLDKLSHNNFYVGERVTTAYGDDRTILAFGTTKNYGLVAIWKGTLSAPYGASFDKVDTLRPYGTTLIDMDAIEYKWKPSP